MAGAPATISVEALYASHSIWLRDWLRRRIRCSDRAADLAQDTFCRLIEGGPSSAPRDPRSYLATIARRLLIDDVRRAKVERTFLDAHAAIMAGVAAPCPERIASAIDELAAVTRALEALSARPRRAYLLSRMEGLSHAEIAAALGVSKSMVKHYVAQAYAHCYAAAYGSDVG
jgi:RNA polymerase sigma factor (sigma-70 family)